MKYWLKIESDKLNCLAGNQFSSKAWNQEASSNGFFCSCGRGGKTCIISFHLNLQASPKHALWCFMLLSHHSYPYIVTPVVCKTTASNIVLFQRAKLQTMRNASFYCHHFELKNGRLYVLVDAHVRIHSFVCSFLCSEFEPEKGISLFTVPFYPQNCHLNSSLFQVERPNLQIPPFKYKT